MPAAHAKVEPSGHVSSRRRPRDGDRTISGEDILAARRGDRSAEQRLYERTLPLVNCVANRFATYQDREDLAQQIYLQLYRSLGKYSGRSAFHTWVWRLAVNEALQHLRRAKRQRRFLAEWRPRASARETVDAIETQEALGKAMRSLESDLRSVLILREMNDRSYDQIADALHLSPGTVASRLSRARRTLRQKLAEIGWDVRA